jgi:hypothetical protein
MSKKEEENLTDPIGGPTDPSDRSFRPTPIDPDQQSRKEPREEPPPKEELGIAAYLLQLFQKGIDLILQSKGRKTTTARKHLESLKIFFEILKKEDRSQDQEFLNQLSKTWLLLLEDSLHFESDQATLAFKAFVKKLQHYPENEPHSFAYYLTENTNQKWIPFPYMELIQKIHLGHQKNPTTSPLAEWSSLLTQLIHLLQRE